MIVVNTHEAKTRLSALLAAVEEGEVVRICRSGKPVAELRRLRPTRDPFRPHPTLSKGQILYDPTEPASEEDWPEENR